MGIGAGGKGQSDIMNSFNKGKENIVALVDVDDRRAVQSRKDFPKANYYRDFRKALEAEGDNVDAVIVSTPDHTHTTIAMEAMRRKKHVYVQKPLTHDIYEARMMAEKAREMKVVTQMGNQGSSGLMAVLSVKYPKYWFGRIVLFGHKEFLIQLRDILYRLNWIGIYG
jgi:predicted dehydrogenase